MSDLPYGICYAVVSSGLRPESFIIETNIRNSEHNGFRSDFELTSRFYVSSGFDHPYGGELEASAYTFTLSNLESAAKVLKKAYKKIETMSKKFGYVKSATETIIRQLQATGCEEVRIADTTTRIFQGWDRVEALSVKNDLPKIREMLTKLELQGIVHFPYTGKI